MNRPEDAGGPVLPLFEINLIGEYADRLRRRRRMARLAEAATIALFVVSGLLLLLALHNVNEARKGRIRIRTIENELKAAIRVVEDIEEQQEELALRLEPFMPLMVIRDRRAAWAPKLAALGEALPAGMSVHKIDGATYGIFGIEKKGSSRRRGKGEEGERRLDYSLLYLPSNGETEDPIGLLLDRLRQSDRFMSGMDMTQLEASEKGTWDKRSVVFYRGLLRGAFEESTP